MTGKLWRVAQTVVTAIVVYLIIIVAIAGIGQMQLVAAVHDMPGVLNAGLILGGPLLIATGLLPALALHVLRVRALAVYIANAVASAPLGFYAFYFNLCIADGLGGILERRPKNGHDLADGWIETVPPFDQMLRSAFNALVSDWPRAVGYFRSYAVLVLTIAGLSTLLFWLLIVRRAARREKQAL